MAVRRAAARALLPLALGAGVAACGEAPAPDAPDAAAAAASGEPSGSARPSPARGRTVRVFFTRTGAGDCTGVEAVERDVGPTEAVATAALRELFAGPTREESRRGLSSLFGPGAQDLLRSVRVEDGTAYLDLHRRVLELDGASTSCGSAALQATIGRTLQQFPTVDEVRYAVEGDPRPFYDLVQTGCPAPARPGDRCDPEPFRR